MATLLSNKSFVRRHVFVVLMVVAWIVAAVFIVVQYGRERSIRISMLDEELQTVNRNILLHYPDLDQVALPAGRALRITVIDTAGRVMYDNVSREALRINHLSRPEVAEALAHGRGYTVDRFSESNSTEYFYSATSSGSLVVRTALPYEASLSAMLRADGGFFLFLAALTLLLAALAVYQHRVALRREDDMVRIKRQLTNNINHELKTPVASVMVCLETLLAHPDMGRKQQRDFTERAMREAERLKSLLDDVSTITRLDDGERMIETETLCLNDIIDEAVETARLRPEAENFYFDIQMPARVEMRGNAGLLRSVFTNLLVNALSYSEGNEVRVCLLSADNQRAVVEVSDNGVGVPEEHLSHIFERFYRIDKGRSRRSGGTGLGLAIVKNAVLFHHGTIRVENHNGLRFEISLPLGI